MEMGVHKHVSINLENNKISKYAHKYLFANVSKQKTSKNIAMVPKVQFRK